MRSKRRSAGLSPITAWGDAFRAWEIAVTAPQVIAMRTARMASAGFAPTARDRREFVRMGSEKVEAFSSAWMALAAEAWAWPLRLAMASTPFASPARVLASAPRFGRALVPIHRKVKANARRLRRSR